MSGSGSTITSRGTVTIDTETCKGCELCITACPPRVLTMTSRAVNRLGHHYPELHPGCTGCAACLLVCPDFCFSVYRYHEPVVTLITPSSLIAPEGTAS